MENSAIFIFGYPDPRVSSENMEKQKENRKLSFIPVSHWWTKARYSLDVCPRKIWCGQSGRKGRGLSFDSLRDYVIGDDVRLMHWATTARKGKPMVRQNRIERSQTIFLVLDAGRMMTARVLHKTKFDHALNSALLLTRSALELGDNVGLTRYCQGNSLLCASSKGPRHFGRILDSTYALEAQLEEPRFYLALSDLSGQLENKIPGSHFHGSYR